MILSDWVRAREVSPMLWLRMAVVAGVLFLSAYLAPRASILYAILPAGTVAVLVFIRKPELGLLALPVSALVVPFALSTGTQTSVHAAVLLISLLFVVWIAEMLRRRAFQFVPSKTNLPLLLFALSAGISFIVGNLPWNYFAGTASLQSQLGGLAIFVFSAIVFLLVGNLVKDLQCLKWVTWLFLALAGGYIVGRLVPGFGWLVSRYPDGSTGSIFWVWLIALAGGQALFNRSLSRQIRLILFMLVAATLYVGWFQARSWVSGWLPPLAALLTLVYLRSWRLGLFITAIGAAGVLIRDPNLLPSLMESKQYSADTRLAAWGIMLGQVIPNNPILGLGPANYYFYTPLYSLWGYYVSFNSHNQYVDILAQTGIVGLMVFIWLMASIARLGWKSRERCGDGFARGYVYGCLAGLAGSLAAGMLGDWFIPFVYNIGLAGFRASMLGWLFLGGLVAIEQIVNREPQSSEAR